ncbi:MAG: S-adenosylmethionine:tRNA ribosyltransferase-isomerase, partial [Actinomycetota bacterium]
RDRLAHRRFADLPGVLSPGDLLVVNNSATRPAEVPAEAGLVVHISTELSPGRLLVEVRHDQGVSSRPLESDPPDTVRLHGGGSLLLDAPLNAAEGRRRLWRAEAFLPTDLDSYLEVNGRPIRYRYVTEPWPLSFYQTIFARATGSAEMPSAGRPFTHGVVRTLASVGVGVVALTLHTGVSSLESGEVPYPEWFAVPAGTAQAVSRTRANGGRVVAVGTTVVRALETAVDRKGNSRSVAGWTDLVVSPATGVRVVDGLITGWHEPRSTHLELLAAIGGEGLVANSYREALSSGYLWHEFGDSHLILAR